MSGATQGIGFAIAEAIKGIAESQDLDPETLKASIASHNRTSQLERFIEPSEIAALAVYLASPRSSATNGAALRADGGVLTGTL